VINVAMRKSSAAGEQIWPAPLRKKRTAVKGDEQLYLGEIAEYNNFLSDLDKVSRERARVS
jgi:hypothetical protein